MSSPILVIAEHNGKKISPSTLRTLSAASQLAQSLNVGIDLLLLSNAEQKPVLQEQAVKFESVARVIALSGEHLGVALAESWAKEIVAVVKEFNASHILAAASAQGKNILPRVAALLDVAQVSEVMSIESPTRFVRPIYAGNAWSTVESQQERHVLTIRTTCFEPVSDQRTDAPEMIGITSTAAPWRGTTLVKQDITEGGRPELTNARVVVSGGFAVGSADNFKMLEQLADKLGGAVGASRAAVDAGFIGNDHQIGQTGKVVAPDLYFAVGISGQVQHLAGMKGSKVIVAINKDPDAPIFGVADYGLVGDLFEVIPQLTAQV
ncbi:MAG: FAD-binding protein [Pseudomonadota bacterium]